MGWGKVFASAGDEMSLSLEALLQPLGFQVSFNSVAGRNGDINRYRAARCPTTSSRCAHSLAGWKPASEYSVFCHLPTPYTPDVLKPLSALQHQESIWPEDNSFHVFFFVLWLCWNCTSKTEGIPCEDHQSFNAKCGSNLWAAPHEWLGAPPEAPRKAWWRWSSLEKPWSLTTRLVHWTHFCGWLSTRTDKGMLGVVGMNVLTIINQYQPMVMNHDSSVIECECFESKSKLSPGHFYDGWLFPVWWKYVLDRPKSSFWNDGMPWPD